ncbi:FliA/WhiG family RNA polymerase sigma factor, partial [bacterium]|nr:FliA/WhiG family RNA polymerase sigma factor [bacterium]
MGIGQQNVVERLDYSDPEIREQQILELIPYVKYIVQRIAFRLPPHIETEDLVNAGVLGLIDAMNKFNPDREVRFKTYAESRVRGAILDELRSQDWIPISIRREARQIERAFDKVSQEKNRTASNEEVAEELSLTLEEFENLLSKVAGVTLLSLDSVLLSDDDRWTHDKLLLEASSSISTPEKQYTALERKDFLAKEIDRLSRKERHVLALYYNEDLTMREIAA